MALTLTHTGGSASTGSLVGILPRFKLGGGRSRLEPVRRAPRGTGGNDDAVTPAPAPMTRCMHMPRSRHGFTYLRDP